jgi:hypothetical protein
MADRGFANSRILQIWEDLKFDYVLRIKEDLIIKTEQGNTDNLQNYARPKWMLLATENILKTGRKILNQGDKQ